MLTLKQLMQRTDMDRKQRANYVKITGMKTGYLKSGLAYVACKSYSTYRVGADGKLVRTENPTHHVTVLTFIDKKLHVHFACSCLDVTYRFEYANWYHGAAEIEYSNGEPPVVQNPRLRASLCKHGVALVEKVKPKLPPGTV